MKASDERFGRNETVQKRKRVCSWWIAVALCGLSFLGGAGTFAVFHGVSVGPRGIAWNRFNDRAAEQSLKLGEIAVSWIEFEVMRDPVLLEWFIEQSESWAPPEPIQSKLEYWVMMRDFHRSLLFLELGTDRWRTIRAQPVAEFHQRLNELAMTLLERDQEARERIREAASARAAISEEDLARSADSVTEATAETEADGVAQPMRDSTPPKKGPATSPEAARSELVEPVE